jgi:MFS family permease
MTGTQSTTAPTAAADGRRLGLALAVIATAQLMVVLDATIVNVALPHIQSALGFSGSGLEWVVNGYSLAFGGLLLLGGRVGDLLGRRRVFVAGLMLFSAASLAGGFATSQAWLLATRAVQGAGAAVIQLAELGLGRACTFSFRQSDFTVRGICNTAGQGRGGLSVVLLAYVRGSERTAACHAPQSVPPSDTRASTGLPPHGQPTRSEHQDRCRCR